MSTRLLAAAALLACLLAFPLAEAGARNAPVSRKHAGKIKTQSISMGFGADSWTTYGNMGVSDQGTVYLWYAENDHYIDIYQENVVPAGCLKFQGTSVALKCTIPVPATGYTCHSDDSYYGYSCDEYSLTATIKPFTFSVPAGTPKIDKSSVTSFRYTDVCSKYSSTSKSSSLGTLNGGGVTMDDPNGAFDLPAWETASSSTYTDFSMETKHC